MSCSVRCDRQNQINARHVCRQTDFLRIFVLEHHMVELREEGFRVAVLELVHSCFLWAGLVATRSQKPDAHQSATLVLAVIITPQSTVLEKVNKAKSGDSPVFRNIGGLQKLFKERPFF